MAVAAQADMQKRKIEVNRLKLISTLESNKTKHVADYESAKAGYKNALLSKLDQAIADARLEIERQYSKRRREANEITDEDIEKQDDYVLLLDAISISMKVPRSFAKEYDAAIDMAKWDVRETLELAHAEFTCFVRDEWDWTNEFRFTTVMYAKAKC